MNHRRSKLQKEILEILKDRKVRTQAQIAEITGANPSSVSRSIKKLVEQDLIIKESAGYVKKGVTLEELTIKNSRGVISEQYPETTSDKVNKGTPISTFDEYHRRNIESAINKFKVTIPRPLQQLEEISERLNSVLNPLSNIADLFNTIDSTQLEEIKKVVSEFDESKNRLGIPNIESMRVDLGLDSIQKMRSHLGHTIQEEIGNINKSTKEKLDSYNNLELERARTAINALGNVDELKNSVEELQKTLGSSQLKSQIENLAEITRMGSSSLNQMISTENAFNTLHDLENNFRLSLDRTIVNYEYGLNFILDTDLSKIYSIEPPPSIGEELFDAIKESSSKMEEFIRFNLGDNMNDLIPRIPEIATSLELASLTYRDMGFSFHNLILPSEEKFEEQEYEVVNDIVRGPIEFKAFLLKIDPKYVDMWEGAWITINTNNPDRVRQSIHSMRTLFDCFIRDHASDEQVREYNNLTSDETVTRKHKIKFILKGSSKDAVELVESYANTFKLQLDYLHKVSHTKELTDTLSIKGVLRLCEDLIYLIIQEMRKWN